MSSRGKKKILVLVEGEKTDVVVMQKLFDIYTELDSKYQIVSYCTNIYVLYQEFFKNKDDIDSLDLLQVLKSREKDSQKKAVFDDKYTDILLIFDLDPHDPLFREDKIIHMQEYFNESSDMGKLYLNYPMVESFYHMTDIPDNNYLDRVVTMNELQNKLYKTRVNKESKGQNYRRFVTNRTECNMVIRQNIEKAFHIFEQDIKVTTTWVEVNMLALLKKQLVNLQSDCLFVLCTCVMYVYDYNCALIFNT